MTAVLIRSAVEADVDQLALLWFDGWQDAHAEVLPADLRRLRTLESFRERLAEALSSVRVAEAGGEIVGFAMLKGDELYQFFVAREARGTRVSPTLMDAALEALRASGAAVAWLACAIGNERAARFYVKSGWRRTGVVTNEVATSAGPFPIEVWRYEIALSAADG